MYAKYYLVMSHRTLVALGFSLRRRDTFEPFSILQILRRRRRSTGVHPYCPYVVMLAALLGSALSKASLVCRSYALRRQTKANLVHYCIEIYLALALLYLGIAAEGLPWYLSPSAPLVWASVAGWLVRSAGQCRRLRPRPLAEWRVDT
jgi:hypothetical protein